MPSLVTKTFADRLQDLIADSGKSIKELSNGIGISSGALSKYQNDGAEAGIDALTKIARYFNVSADWLLGIVAEPTSDPNIKAICNYTGLSGDAITLLADWHCAGGKNQSIIDNVSDLLIDPNYFVALVTIEDLKERISRMLNIVEQIENSKYCGDELEQLINDFNSAWYDVRHARFDAIDDVTSAIEQISEYRTAKLIWFSIQKRIQSLDSSSANNKDGGDT